MNKNEIAKLMKVAFSVYDSFTIVDESDEMKNMFSFTLSTFDDNIDISHTDFCIELNNNRKPNDDNVSALKLKRLIDSVYDK